MVCSMNPGTGVTGKRKLVELIVEAKERASEGGKKKEQDADVRMLM